MSNSAIVRFRSMDEESEMSVDSSPAAPPMPSRSQLERISSLGNKDTKMIRRLKCELYTVLFLSAIAASFSTFHYMEVEDTRWYTDEFQERTDEILKGLEACLINSLEASANMGGSWTLQTTNQDENHSTHGANVTYPNFAVLGSALADSGIAQMMAVAPIVPAANRTQWEAYAFENQQWIASDLSLLSNAFRLDIDNLNPGKIPPHIYGYEEDDRAQIYLPIWQLYPTPQNASRSPIMHDLLANDWFANLWNQTVSTDLPAMSAFEDVESLVEYADYEQEQDKPTPKFVLVERIEGGYEESDGVVAAAVTVVSWGDYFSLILEDQPSGIIVDLHYNCANSNGVTYSFKKTTDSLVYIGENIDHSAWNIALTKRYNLFGEGAPGPEWFLRNDYCGYIMTIHAQDEFIVQWQRNDSYFAAILVAAIFGFTALVFFTYDFYVQRRNRTVTNTAARSTAIVSSLFPNNVATQMMEEVEHGPSSTTTGPRSATMSNAVQQLIGPLTAPQTVNPLTVTKKAAPIADLFTETTIMFADIAGFTKWSSTHEPSDVFTLLETIFNAFDKIADRRRVFKVETVGDCYVAVCGLPEPTPDHAVVMARFAWECMRAMGKLKKKLEKKLGPDTRELDMRFGLHSGPVTGGVIRGERPRFQLFGDSMNKTSRIESSGQKGRVHISEEMATILKASGKGHWLSKREDTVNLKGLGAVPTYWLGLHNARHSATGSVTSHTSTESSEPSLDEELTLIKNQINGWKNPADLTAWHSNNLGTCLLRIVQARQASNSQIEVDENGLQSAEISALFGHADASDRIQFASITTPQDLHPQSTTKLDETTKLQLCDFIQQISDAYNPHPFNNIQRASHVVTSLKKLLVSTKGTLDPLTEFALVLSALVHDVDHPGVSNELLVAENDALAKIYASSQAERNSLDVFWKIFCQESFHKLRRTVYETPEEFEHFRQVMVQSILATDVANKILQQHRIKRWKSCLVPGSNATPDQCKTCLVEQLAQTCDIAHTMQPWGSYQKFNSQLYDETSAAFRNGRGDKDPKDYWYRGELTFFNDVVIPVATFLSQQESFAKSGKGMLESAEENRREWRESGKEVVSSL